jgi:hypothetical protein
LSTGCRSDRTRKRRLPSAEPSRAALARCCDTSGEHVTTVRGQHRPIMIVLIDYSSSE